MILKKGNPGLSNILSIVHCRGVDTPSGGKTPSKEFKIQVRGQITSTVVEMLTLAQSPIYKNISKESENA